MIRANTDAGTSPRGKFTDLGRDGGVHHLAVRTRIQNKRKHFMDKINENAGKMETHLKAWGLKLDELAAAVEASGSEAKSEYRKQLDDLKLKHYAVKLKLDALKDAGSDKWEVFKKEAEGVWNDIEGAFKNLKK
jgi:hypothetical protein